MQKSIALIVTAVALMGCSKKEPELPRCKPSPVGLVTWKRAPLKYIDASILVPITAHQRLIPNDEGSLGEAWDDLGWAIYYKRDSTLTNHTVETSAQVTDMVTCIDTTSGMNAKVTLLHSTATSLSGEFGQAEWALPKGGTLFVAVLTRQRTSRDSLLRILQSVRFGKGGK